MGGTISINSTQKRNGTSSLAGKRKRVSAEEAPNATTSETRVAPTVTTRQFCSRRRRKRHRQHEERGGGGDAGVEVADALPVDVGRHALGGDAGPTERDRSEARPGARGGVPTPVAAAPLLRHPDRARRPPVVPSMEHEVIA